jgi:hypothetical protein
MARNGRSQFNNSVRDVAFLRNLLGVCYIGGEKMRLWSDKPLTFLPRRYKIKWKKEKSTGNLN